MTGQTEKTGGDKTASAAAAKRRANWWETVGLVAIYAILLLTLSSMSEYFFSVGNFMNILIAVSVIGIMAITMTMVIVSGGIDLSIGSVVALSGVMVAQLSHSIGIWPAVGVAVGLGIFVGAFNGFAVTYIRINPLIATLGTLSIARGFAYVYSGGLTQTIDSEAFRFLGQGRLLESLVVVDKAPDGIPFQVIVLVALFALAAWVMRNTVFGRSIYAVGGNAQASRLAGLPVRRLQMWVYTLCGLGAAVGGLIQASQLGAGAPAASQGIELSVIADVILGGTSLSGGKGTIWGTLLGVLIMGTLNNGLTLLGVSSFYQEVARGTVLLVAVGLDQLRLQLANRA
jgi:ribose transport system permease protein